MKRFISRSVLSLIIFASLFVGIIKGQKVRQKWVAKMKNRQVEKRVVSQPAIVLDEIEIATYHS
ncbi:MAG TPA: hypothetical protein VK644_12580 [Chitinophagaceae bacterium]|nr:hypothetical protein [Chitinophagaceae bacterium]